MGSRPVRWANDAEPVESQGNFTRGGSQRQRRTFRHSKSDLRDRVSHRFIVFINRAGVPVLDGLPLNRCRVEIKRLLKSGDSPLGQLDVFPGTSCVTDYNNPRANHMNGLSKVHSRQNILRTT